MNISSQMAAMTYSLQSAVRMSMMQKVMHQDVQSMDAIMEMSKDVAKMTGKGQSLDIKV
ncbi:MULTISPECIES: hypothetical protein [unclassified Fusibacter]|uniref:hypothetical protein n=1 Tax=unclassified Fusibacter TaxID=2624464 RepID=UPI0013E91F15|nr:MULTISPECIES: hypothetical protein [unclassified Fusibacter]MCK8059827.1 hypothetical protein [Fusibacter sp. A2]NPE21628.1 hypothetical protein [Fusibacter sp. A1]